MGISRDNWTEQHAKFEAMTQLWKRQTEARLLEPDSQFVFTKAALMGLARACALSDNVPSDSTLNRWVKELLMAHKLTQVTKGLYLNRLGHRDQDAAEAAQWMRRGSVLSLSWVLERAGVLNNMGSTYTCIIPLDASITQPQLTSRDVPGVGTFRFYAMKADLVDEAAGKRVDVFDQRFNYRRATPEKALLDWIYLGHSHRSRLAPPPMDLEVNSLNRARLNRLAKGMRISHLLDAWIEQWRRYQQDPAVMENGGGIL